VATGDETIHHPGFDVEVVDTVGAGDSFVAAFIAGYLRQGSWRECAALANAMGAAVVATQGAGRCVPDATKIIEILGDDPARRLVKGVAQDREPR
jgi:sugar/nucleoside kinase (ribokinase family)